MKIAASHGLPKAPPAEERKGRFKRWAKNTALIAGGYAAGQGAGELTEHWLKKRYGAEWSKSQPANRMKVLKPVMGMSGMALAGAAVHLHRKLQEAEQDKKKDTRKRRG